MTATRTPTIGVGAKRYPIVLPNRRDPRLHTAAVIISVHILGITALGFRVSVPQILSAVLVSALIDLVLTFRRTGALVWPASGMLTGSGVALILRLTGMGRGEFWSFEGWYWFAIVAGASVLSKHVIKYRGTHLFNPSNLGLVVVFLVLGSAVVEPLDFWWSPLNVWMVIAYAVIILGGTLITRRLGLFALAATFWLTLSLGLGILSASGHCMTTAWSLTPVCGFRFWWVVMTSPEILIFLFFMITDPKTVPSGRAARVLFAVSLGLLCTVLMAPQTVEFGAKVALLSGLVILSPIRGLYDHVPGIPIGDFLRGLGNRLVSGRSSLIFTRGAFVGGLLTLMTLLIVFAGSPAREPTPSLGGQPGAIGQIDPADLPTVTVDPDIARLNADIDVNDAQDLAVTLAEDLAIEGEAMRQVDASLLVSGDAGERLTEMQSLINDAVATGERPVSGYTFETLHLGIAGSETGQTGAALGFTGTGTVETVTYDALGAEKGRVEEDFQATFVLRQIAGDRWLIVKVLDGS
ncbi:MAG: hypothetical protein WB245_09415 [Acidimicrobiia bacterium]